MSKEKDFLLNVVYEYHNVLGRSAHGPKGSPRRLTRLTESRRLTHFLEFRRSTNEFNPETSGLTFIKPICLVHP